MTRFMTMAASVAAYFTMFSGTAFARSERAYSSANCNASFLGCSSEGSAAPIGELGSGTLEVLLVAAVIFLFAGKPLMRRMRGLL